MDVAERDAEARTGGQHEPGRGWTPRRILVRAPNWVGDLVMATPTLARLRRGYPDAHITVGLRPYLRPLLSGSRDFDAILDLPRAGGWRGLRVQVAAVRERRFDLAVVLPNSLESGLLVRLAGIPHRLGYRQGRPFTMTMGPRERSPRPLLRRHGPRRHPRPMPQYYADLLDLLQLPQIDDRPRLQVTAEEDARADSWLRARGVAADAGLLLLNAGASFGASKLWLPDRFAAVARALRQRLGLVPVFLAGPAEVELVRRIAAQADALHTADPVWPLSDLKALVRRAKLMVTTDTGPRHIAVAFAVPVVCLIGPTDPRYTDYCLGETTLIRHPIECAPCHRKTCPLGHHDCMRRIEVGEVAQAAVDLLARLG